METYIWLNRRSDLNWSVTYRISDSLDLLEEFLFGFANIDTIVFEKVNKLRRMAYVNDML